MVHYNRIYTYNFVSRHTHSHTHAVSEHTHSTYTTRTGTCTARRHTPSWLPLHTDVCTHRPHKLHHPLSTRKSKVGDPGTRRFVCNHGNTHVHACYCAYVRARRGGLHENAPFECGCNHVFSCHSRVIHVRLRVSNTEP